VATSSESTAFSAVSVSKAAGSLVKVSSVGIPDDTRPLHARGGWAYET
jgi:hypothetical protein